MERRYFQPETLEEALGLLAGEAKGADVVAGGTDLMVAARGGKRSLGPALLALHTVSKLRGISEQPDGGLRLRALTTHAELEGSSLVRARWSALADAAALVGSPATRHVGTLGGNLANGSPAMETGSPLLVFDARIELASKREVRDLSIADFLKGPGETARRADELLVGVNLPPPPAGHFGSAYLRLEYRQAMEIAVVGAAALIALDETGRIGEARLALTAVAPVCLRALEAEALLRGAEPGEAAFRAAAQEAGETARPIDDVRAPAAYRRAMVPVVARRALELALSRARGEALPRPAAQALDSDRLQRPAPS